ncbi:fungal specific transcription factor domain-containing protein [Sarocladium implicatum]|nr:fungal specific transcription factor domain-containing protein [Sarocladium implicatum]
MDQTPQQTPRKKRARKTRGRGLRTRTGCLTCRKRHKKCDERQPVCGPCSTSSRHCVFPRDLDAQSALEALTQAPRCPEPLQDSQTANTAGDNNGDLSQITSYDTGEATHLASINEAQTSQGHAGSPNGVYMHVVSPQEFNGSLASWTSETGIRPEKWTARGWLDLLANDAAQADGSFSLAPSPEPGNRTISKQLRHSTLSAHVSPAVLNGQVQLPGDLDPESERQEWQLAENAVLTDHEAMLLRHFADTCARWLDIFDPERLFSTYAIRLSLKNPGLMKAILALSAKHRATCMGTRHQEAGSQMASPAEQPATEAKDSEWIGYYYETLFYIRSALGYSSYAHSEELLATAIVISSYEMLDEADESGNWQRHLKGVFWIQKSQGVHGASGGLRQSIWWSWHRQDTWAAFREKRACLSFWKPNQRFEDLTQYELANRSVYLLAQALNYCAEARRVEADVGSDETLVSRLRRRREDVLTMMEQWKGCLGEEFDVLPTPKAAGDVFTPLWIHPPEFGVALQAYNLALILITLNTPNTSGLNAFLRMQKQLTGAVETICGIAMELKEEDCQIISAQYLYGAGLCVQEQNQRRKILSLIEDCERRAKWAPIATWREDLQKEWAKADNELDA